MKYKPTIGLEIHAELLTKTKMFCGCENAFGGEANVRICPVCMGYPGTLPVVNREAVLLGVRAGLVLGCRINEQSSFDRKNYFYPDLPKAYQITQQYNPLCSDGAIEIDGKRFRINNIHLEEDAGKLIHEGNVTIVDYNRCGVPLIEIVTEPDFTSPDEVAAFVEELALRLKYADVCDGKMEQGSLRVDLNVSVMPVGSEIPGIRTETKNLGSVKSLKKAIVYEIQRQISVLEKGGTVVCETRRYDEDSGKTIRLRDKEGIEDYNYFPEPDIPHIIVSDRYISEIAGPLTEMPNSRAERYIKIFGLTSEEAENIVSDKDFSDYYDGVCSKCKYPKKAASLMLVGLNKLYNKFGGSVLDMKFSQADFAFLTDLWGDGKVSSGNAFELLEMMFLSGEKPDHLADKNNMLISFDKNAALKVINEIISENDSAVSDYKKGNKKAFGYFMGLAVSRLGKNTDPAAIKILMEECLKG